jgi:hypothetical protein
MPRRYPLKVDRAGDSTVGVVAVVMVFLFVHVDGEERAAWVWLRVNEKF